MTVVFAILYLLVHVLILAVLGRFAVDMIQSFARGWRPQGASLVLASSIYAVTDPILNPLRRLIPPLRLGGIALDLSSMILIFGLVILESVCISLLVSA
ncbi:YggT family protein [Kocuria sp. SL71]|uniref:YggT family protein n=1 Tax=Kocuria sp. SL71 TaxID=2995151 RepID=UPI0022742710|nr:YggT family protein [Kocuria sp. SL71]MCY1683788.1 YggT family protein [Kocuria sp. SL71]